MKLIRVFLFVITLLSLGACYPASTAQIISPVGTVQVTTTAPVTISVTPIPFTEEVITPTFGKAPIKPAVTSEEENEIPMLITQSLTITIIYDNDL